MTVQPEGRTLAMTVTGEELKCRGWTAFGLTHEQALTLAQSVCPGRVIRVEIYPAFDGVLIFASWKPATRPPARRPLRRGRVRRT